MSSLRRRVTAIAGGAALTLGVAVAPTAQAAPSATAPVVINEVYGGGGNTGALYQRDFVELTNVSDKAVDLGAWSIQYASATGTTWQVTPLAGKTLPAGASLVVGEGIGAGGTLAVPTDVSGTILMSASAGKVALVSNATALANCGADCSDLASVVDFVGYGSTANDYAGTGPALGASNTASVSRNAAHTNTPDNAADFSALTPPTPTACGDACTVVTPPPAPTITPIAAIQGTGAASPLAGQTVTTTGVITAAYPKGGLNGFFFQTSGTGKAHPEGAASDGIFVYTRTFDAVTTVGNFVQVTGKVVEYNGLTEISATEVLDAGDDFAPVTPLATSWPRTETGRESLEGMLLAPKGPFTVTNTYTTGQYGEIGLAAGTTPLIQPTELAVPGSAAAIAIEDDNIARAVTLDDGATTNYLAQSYSTATCGTRPIPCLVNGDLTPPYVSNTEPVRVGAPAEFTDPVVLDYRYNLWRFQPTTQVLGPQNEASPVSVTNTRTSAPDSANIGNSDIRVASFNVLNLFTDLGVDNPECTAYTDRDGDGNNVRGGCLQRGAWDPEDLQRQREKIVSAINGLDADIVGLMEIENSAWFGHSRDTTLRALVKALNEQAGPGTWAFVPSPTNLPPLEEQDVITNAIIYKPGIVMKVDQSIALGDQSSDGEAFANAREPIGQVFRARHGKSTKFFFVVNHFKSKGSAGPFPGDEDTGDGQGSSVTSRILQAQALLDWIPTAVEQTSTKAVILVGDFNSYTMEDPMQVLYEGGFTDLGSKYDPAKWSYSFDSLSGSLDHVLANDAAMRLVTGADHWAINSGESILLEYSRWNYTATDFHDPGPYRSSDHDPVVAGLLATAPRK